MTYALGVDGGGSKTVACVCDETGRIVGVGRAGGANHQAVGVQTAIVHVREAALEALGTAGLSPQIVDRSVYALAGADGPADTALLHSALADLPLTSWSLVCDTVSGLRTGVAGGVGVVLVCGSGTNAYGVQADGVSSQVGGYGYLYGDDAGGQAIATAGFRAAVRSAEGRSRATVLTRLVPRALGYDGMDEWIADSLRRGVASAPLLLAETVHEGERLGDNGRQGQGTGCTCRTPTGFVGTGRKRVADRLARSTQTVSTTIFPERELRS